VVVLAAVVATVLLPQRAGLAVPLVTTAAVVVAVVAVRPLRAMAVMALPVRSLLHIPLQPPARLFSSLPALHGPFPLTLIPHRMWSSLLSAVVVAVAEELSLLHQARAAVAVVGPRLFYLCLA
jgi:hypothetical protein